MKPKTPGQHVRPFPESPEWKTVKGLLEEGLDVMERALDDSKVRVPSAYQRRLEKIEATFDDRCYVITYLPLPPEGCLTVIPRALWPEYLEYRRNGGYSEAELRDAIKRPKRDVIGHVRWSIPTSLGQWAGLVKRENRRLKWDDRCYVKAGTTWIEIWNIQGWESHRAKLLKAKLLKGV